MTESTLVLLLKRFDKQQLKDFNNFVKSPFFNTNKALIKLYEYIRKQYPEFSPEKLDKQYVYRKIFGKTQFNDGFLRVLMSNLQNLAEEYLTYLGVSGSPLVKKKYLLDQLSSLGERKLGEKILNRELKSIKNIIPKDPEDYLGMYYITFYKKYFYSMQFSVNKGNKPDESMYDEQKYITFHFLLIILSNCFFHLNQSQIINYEPKLTFLDGIIIFLSKNPEFLESPILNITFLRVLLLKNNDINDYYKLKNTFYDISEKLDQKDCFNTISIIINYCQKNFFLTDDELFHREKLEILKFGLEKKLHKFEKDEGFDPGRFNNIVNTALDFNEVEWVEDFIGKYSNEIEPEKKDYLAGFVKASVNFAKGNFDETMKYLAKLKNPSAVTDKFNLKVLQLRLYYEKNFLDQAESAADSFRHLVQNDKLLPQITKEAYRNFHSIYTRLITLKSRGNGAAEELREMVKSTKPVTHKKWIYEKIDEL